VNVRRHAGDWRIATYRIEDLENVHWDTISGGVHRRFPFPLLFAYVWCDRMVDGEVAHSGAHGPCPHRIKVCILKCDNDRETYAYLAKLAGEKPPRPPFCREDAIRLVKEHGEIRGPELRAKLEALGHSPWRISYVLPKLEGEGVLVSRREGRAKVYRLKAGNPDKKRILNPG